MGNDISHYAELHGKRLFQRVAFDPNLVLGVLSGPQIQDGARFGRYTVEVEAILDWMPDSMAEVWTSREFPFLSFVFFWFKSIGTHLTTDNPLQSFSLFSANLIKWFLSIVASFTGTINCIFLGNSFKCRFECFQHFFHFLQLTHLFPSALDHLSIIIPLSTKFTIETEL